MSQNIVLPALQAQAHADARLDKAGHYPDTFTWIGDPAPPQDLLRKSPRDGTYFHKIKNSYPADIIL